MDRDSPKDLGILLECYEQVKDVYLPEDFYIRLRKSKMAGKPSFVMTGVLWRSKILKCEDLKFVMIGVLWRPEIVKAKFCEELKLT